MMSFVVGALCIVLTAVGCQASGVGQKKTGDLDLETRAQLVLAAVKAREQGRFADCARLRIDSIERGMDFPENFVAAAECLALSGDRVGALTYLSLAFDKGLKIPREELASNKAFASLAADPDFATLIERAASSAPPVQDEALRQELLAMQRTDQSARVAIDPRLQDAEAAALVRQLDLEHAKQLDAIIERVGWPGKTLVGDDGAHAAWLILQHSTPEMMRCRLPLIEAAAARGEASHRDVAYLVDRVLVFEGKLQRYGTQIVVSGSGLVPAPIENESEVDTRRAAVGLGPLAVYVAESNAALNR